MDFSGCSVAVRDRQRERAAGPAYGSGKLAVEDAQDPYPRRRSAQASLSTLYYLQKKDIDRFLAKFDEYKKVNHLS